MGLKEILAQRHPPERLELEPAELTRLFWKYKGLEKNWERANAFWAATNDNLKQAYEQLDEKDRELERAYHIIQDDLGVASKIQHSLLPTPLDLMNTELEIAVYHRQLAQVGGDYYDFFELDDGRYAFGVFDISGHGVSAALVMTYLKALFMGACRDHHSPRAIVEQVNRDAIGFLSSVKKYATVNFVAIDEEKVRYCSGGGFGLIIHEGEAQSFTKRDPFLGLRARGFHEFELPFTSGDLLVLFTDGMIEAQNAEGEDYTLGRLTQQLVDHHDRPVEELLNRCVDDYQRFRRVDHDDITLLILRRK